MMSQSNSDKKIKAWFAILSDTEKNYTSLALMSVEGRTALRQMAEALRFLSLEKETSLNNIQEEIIKLKELNIPLSWVATQAIFSNQNWKVIAIKEVLGEHWNTWKKEVLWPLGFTPPQKDVFFPENLPDFIFSESHALQVNPLLVSELFYYPSLMKNALSNDFDPTIALTKLKTLSHPDQLALGACLWGKESALDTLWKDGRVQSHQPSLTHALICSSRTAIRKSDDVWFERIMEKINQDHLFEPQKFIWNLHDNRDTENLSPLYYLLDGCLMKYPHRWDMLKHLPFEKLPKSEIDSLLTGQIRTLLSFGKKERVKHMIDMFKTLFESTHPGENWTKFLLTGISSHQGSVWNFLEISNFIIKNELFSKLDLSDIAVFLKDSDPFYKIAQHPDHQSKSEKQLSVLFSDYIRRNANHKMEELFLWSPTHLKKWITLVKEEDRDTVQKWSQVLLEFSQGNQNHHQSMLQRVDFLNLQATLSPAPLTSKAPLRI